MTPHLHCGDALEAYDLWPTPTVIVADGPYGVSGFPGDPPTPHGLADWYTPHIKAWSKYATPYTTLWFWCTEVGWASVHHVLEAHGWEYNGCNIWDKGIAHIAGNCNTQTMRKFPVVTEVCVQYTKPATFTEQNLPMKEWLRNEWNRTGLPLYKTNEACGVKNAASRKYFTLDHLWYFPPVQAMTQIVTYANTHGDPTGRPYFSLNGKEPLSESDWAKMRSKFYLEPGLTNVWDTPALRNHERIKVDKGLGHPNQKPLELMQRIIKASSDPGDVVWEPFGGLCSASVAATRTGRKAYAAEIQPPYQALARSRLQGDT